jgi:F-type H+-transporting ATPase subunit alpha
MPVGEQVAILYCGTRGLMKDIPIDRVQAFQEAFLERMRAAHRSDILEPLGAGVLTPEIGTAIEEEAARIIAAM